jgi:hypothetical protein
MNCSGYLCETSLAVELCRYSSVCTVSQLQIALCLIISIEALAKGKSRDLHDGLEGAMVYVCVFVYDTP